MTDDPDREARAEFEAMAPEKLGLRYLKRFDYGTYESERIEWAWRGFRMAWTTARRPDAGLRVTDEAVGGYEAINEAYAWAKTQSPSLREAVLKKRSALPHLLPDAGRDKKDARIAKLEAIIHEMVRLSPDNPDLENVALTMLDADRARAEDKEAGDE